MVDETIVYTIKQNIYPVNLPRICGGNTPGDKIVPLGIKFRLPYSTNSFKLKFIAIDNGPYTNDALPPGWGMKLGIGNLKIYGLS